jgi:hypothetical protein
MEIKNCEDRKLGVFDCELLERDLGVDPIKNVTQIFIVPQKSTQGYFLSGNGGLEQNPELTPRRFGVPNQITRDFDLKIANLNHQRKSKCCGWSQSIQISCSGKDYASPLHKVVDTPGLMKDLEEILKIQRFEYFFGRAAAVEMEPQPRTLKGFVKIDFRPSPSYPSALPPSFLDTGITFAIWRVQPENESQRTVLVVQRFFSPASNREAEKVVRSYFEKLKDDLTALYYSRKVKDVIGGLGE